MKDWFLKDRLIRNILIYLKSKDSTLKESILSDLKKFSNIYNHNIKKSPKIDLYSALIQFLDEGQPIGERINKLNSSIT